MFTLRRERKMFWKLREDVSLRITEEALEFHGENGVGFKNAPKRVKRMARRLEFGICDEVELSSAEAMLLRELVKRELVVSGPESEERNCAWNAHYSIDGGKLGNKSVLIIGCGGTGAVIADHLARAGIGYFGLIDGALLDAPDLNRQFTYRRKDIGRPKVELLKSYLERETRAKVLESHYKYLNRSNWMSVCGQYDLIINCADKPKFEIQKLAIKLAEKKNCPVIFGSVGIRDYIIGPLIDSSEQKTRYLRQMEREAAAFGTSSKAIKGSNPLLNTKAAVDIAIRSFEYLSGCKSLDFVPVRI